MKKNNTKKIISNNLFIFKYALVHAPAYTLMSCLFTSLHTVLMYFEHTYMLKYIIDCIQYERPFKYAFYYILAIFFSISLWLCINWFWWSIARGKLREKLARDIQFDIYKKAADIDISCYDDPEYYNDFVWSMNDANGRIDAVVGSFESLIKSITGLLVCGGFMITYDVLGIAFVLGAFIGSYIVNIATNKVQFKQTQELRPIQRRRDYISRVFYLGDYAKEMRLTKIKGKLYEDYEKTNDDAVKTINKHSSKLSVLSFISDFGLNSFIFNGLYIIYLLFRTMVLYAISYGTMVMLYQTSSQLKNAVSSFTSAIPRFHENSLYIDKLRGFLSYEKKIKDGKEIITKSISSFEFKNVSFSYLANTEPILKNINLRIKSKEKIAIVGHNGAGKTTLINLLLRLYDVTEGEIRVNDINIKELQIQGYKENISTVFQDFQIYAANVSQNVAMDIIYDVDKVKKALIISGIHKKIEGLPNDINTVLTKEFENNGTELSGGESQKIAIARAIYKDTDIIIFDEASSALDPISEYNLNKTIMNHFKDRTVIFISHRLSTTRMADRIYLLDNGIIFEEGNHDELMKMNGIYANMFNLQAEKYKNSKKTQGGTDV